MDVARMNYIIKVYVVTLGGIILFTLLTINLLLYHAIMRGHILVTTTLLFNEICIICSLLNRNNYRKFFKVMWEKPLSEVFREEGVAVLLLMWTTTWIFTVYSLWCARKRK